MQQQQQQQQLAAGRQAGPGSSVTGDTAERNRIFAREAFDLGMEIIEDAPIKIRRTLSQLVLMKYNVWDGGGSVPIITTQEMCSPCYNVTCILYN